MSQYGTSVDKILGPCREVLSGHVVPENSEVGELGHFLEQPEIQIRGDHVPLRTARRQPSGDRAAARPDFDAAPIRFDPQSLKNTESGGIAQLLKQA